MSYKNIFRIILLCLLAMNSYATKRYWRGTGTNKNWNNTANWSATSGGTTGASVPGVNDSVYYDSGGDSICTVNAAVSIKYLNVAGSYTKTISQGANAFTVGTSGAVLSGGTFSGGSSTITISSFTLSGTVFTSTSGLLNISGTYSFSGGTFTHNSGEVKFSGTTQSVTGSTTFYHLTITASTLTITAGTILTVNNLLDLNNAAINTGDIYAKGTIQENGTSTSGGGTGTITINGSGTQTFSGQTSYSRRQHGWAPNIVIKKSSSDTLYLKNWITVKGNWMDSSGVLNITTYPSTLCFPSGTANTISGNASASRDPKVDSLLITNTGGASTMLTVNSGDTLFVAHSIINQGVAAVFMDGIYNLKGDIIQDNLGNGGTSTGGTGTIYIDSTSTANQTIVGASSIGLGRICSLKIDKKTGSLTYKNTVNIGGDYILIRGTPDVTTYNSTVCFAYSSGRTISGKPVFNNLSFYGSSTSSSNTLSDTVIVNGELRFEGTAAIVINTGTVRVKGDINITNTVNTAGGGTGYLHICNTGTQNFIGNGVAQTCYLCNVKIDKPSGTLNLSSYISLAGTSTWKYIRGIVNPGTSVFTVAGGTTIDADAMHFYDFRVQASSTAALASDLHVNNLLYIQASRIFNCNSHNVYVGGDWDNNGTFTIGTGKVIFNGSASQYLLHPTTGQTLYDAEVNKSSGKLYLYNTTLTVNHALTLTKGIIAGSSTKQVNFIDNATVSGASDSSYVHGFVKKTGNDAFTFPLGDTVLSSGAYHLLTMTAPSSTSDAYTAVYRDSVQYSGDSLQVDSLSAKSTCERWILTRNAGSSTVIPTLGWNSNSCNVDGCHRLRVTGWDGARWRSLGYNGITTSGSMGTVKAASGYSTTTLPLIIAWPINPSLAPTVTVTSGRTICSGTGTSLTASGASTYSWAPSTGLSATTGATVTASPSATTTYTVTGTNSIGCTGTATVTVTVNTSPTVSASPASSVIGTGGSVALTASGASTYTWNPTTSLSPTTGASVTSTPASDITYTVTGTAANGCTGTATASIKVSTICVTESMMSGVLCIQSPVILSASGDKGCTQPLNLDFGDGYDVDDTVSDTHAVSVSHLFSAVGNYVLTIKIYDTDGYLLRTDTSHITLQSCAAECDDCIPSFAPVPAKKYELSAWAKQSGASDTVTIYTTPKITVSSAYGGYSVSFTPSGPIIDGWQKIDGEFTLPGLATNINIKLESTSGDTYFDDIRVFPFDGSMKSYVYDPVSMRLVAELDERNYATFYEYDEEGKLVRVKKETERGIMTIKENRNNTSK
ncbi:MAG: hypothetical protein ACJ77K_06350 [Bacteroidia bacterium]